MAYEIGDRAKVFTDVVFQSAGGTPFDPPVVTFQVKAPGADTVSYVYDVNGDKDEAITKNGTGDYSCEFDVETPGRWRYYIKGETAAGDNRGSHQGSFYVNPKKT